MFLAPARSVFGAPLELLPEVSGTMVPQFMWDAAQQLTNLNGIDTFHRYFCYNYKHRYFAYTRHFIVCLETVQQLYALLESDNIISI